MNNGAQTRTGKGNGFFSLRSISGYLRIVSSGASTVASTVRSAGESAVSSLADNDGARNQVHWAGFDKIEYEDNSQRKVLLLGYSTGFEVWDVEQANDVHQLASRHDGPVSFLQVLKKPLAERVSEDRFAGVRPLLIIAVADGSVAGGVNGYDGAVPSCDRSNGSYRELGSGNCVSTSIRFYSLKTRAYVHVLKFRSPVYSIRCSPRVVAVSQAAQIHCFDAATLKREYTSLTYPIVSGCVGSGGISYGPLAVGSRWLAYSGIPVVFSGTGRVSPQHLKSTTSCSSYSSNGSVVAHYAKESSKHLASGIVTLGDMGYKKLSKYYSDFLPDANNSSRQGGHNLKANGANGHFPDAENAGMVIVRDLVSKSVIVQFRAHRSPISALCFDPSGTLLVTASIHGHNINIFHVMPPSVSNLSESDVSGSYVHLYKLQRGFTNAVIQDISFSEDSQYITISSSRGTSHLFALSGGFGNPHPYDFSFTNNSSTLVSTNKVPLRWPSKSNLSKVSPQDISTHTTPVLLSAVSRIRNGSNGWKGTVSGAAAAATGRVTPLCGAVASAFHNCNGVGIHLETKSSRTNYYMLVFSPSGSVIQYVLRHTNGSESGIGTPSYEFSQDTDSGVVVEALQKWDVCNKHNRMMHGNNIDIYGENGSEDSIAFFTRGAKNGTSVHPPDSTKDATPKLNPEDKHHMYLSEVELHTHPVQVPLWAKAEIYFHVMMDDYPKGYDSDLHGEIEIERIPTRIIEASSKNLIPAFDYLRMPKFQQSRINMAESKQNGPFLRQRSGHSEERSFSRRSSCSSTDCIIDSALVAQASHGMHENGWGSYRASSESSINSVNNRNCTNVNTQREFINSIIEGAAVAEASHDIHENFWGSRRAPSESNMVSVNNMDFKIANSQLEFINNTIDGAAVAEASHGIHENGWGSHRAPSERSMDFVNNRVCTNVNTQLEFANNLIDGAAVVEASHSIHENFCSSRRAPSESNMDSVNNRNFTNVNTPLELINSITDGAAVAEASHDIHENGWGSHRAPSESSMDFVNNRDCTNVNTQLEFVNNIEALQTEALLECVNNKESLKIESLFEDGDNEID